MQRVLSTDDIESYESDFKQTFKQLEVKFMEKQQVVKTNKNKFPKATVIFLEFTANHNV